MKNFMIWDRPDQFDALSAIFGNSIGQTRTTFLVERLGNIFVDVEVGQ
jgi:hypothetical protein